MRKTLIIHDTDSDRRFTETMVPYVREGAESVDGMEIKVKFVDHAETEDVFWADGIAIGCPTHLGGHRLSEWVGYYVEGRKDLHPLQVNYQRFWELAD